MKTGGNQRQEFNKYTGLTDFKIVGINPDQEELGKILGKTIDKEPTYTKETDEGETKTRVVFYLKTDDAPEEVFSHTIFVSDAIHTIGKEDKAAPVWVNRYLQTAKAGSLEEIEARNETVDASWKVTRLSDLREAYRGEIQLLRFFSTLYNQVYDKDDEEHGILFDSFAKIVQGDVTELREAVDGTENKIRLMLGVNDRGQQDIYGKFDLFYNCYLAEGQAPPAKWVSILTGEYGWNADYQGKVEFQKYDPQLANIVLPSVQVPGAPVVPQSPQGVAEQKPANKRW